MPYLSTINYILDKECFFEDLVFVKTDIEKQKKYASAGIKNHYKTDKSPSEMAYWVLSNFLKNHEFIRNEIDTVIFTTDNLDRSNDMNVVTINSLLQELGIPSNLLDLFIVKKEKAMYV